MQELGELSASRPEMATVKLGEPFHTYSLSRVIQVGGNSGAVKVGDIVESRAYWADYCVVKKDAVNVKK